MSSLVNNQEHSCWRRLATNDGRYPVDNSAKAMVATLRWEWMVICGGKGEAWDTACRACEIEAFGPDEMVRILMPTCVGRDVDLLIRTLMDDIDRQRPNPLIGPASSGIDPALYWSHVGRPRFI